MEPSATNSKENHHKTLTPTTHHHDHDHHHHDHDPHADDHDRSHEPFIASCEITPHQEINGSSHQTFLTGDGGSRLDKWLGNEPSGREEPMKEVSAVVIPERWGQEGLLKDWMDYSTFDALLAPKEAEPAREALVAEARLNV